VQEQAGTDDDRASLGLELASSLPAVVRMHRHIPPLGWWISPRWDAAGRAVTLVVLARGHDEAGRCIGRRRGVSDPLEAFAQWLGGGVPVRLEVWEIG
jgi:hypothetical protein